MEIETYNMMSQEALDRYYEKHGEPVRSLLMGVRDIILQSDARISHQMKYGMPFFSFEGRMICYLWFHRRFQLPYLGLVDGSKFHEPFLIQEKRARMKIMLLDPKKDIPIRRVRSILKKAIEIKTRK